MSRCCGFQSHPAGRDGCKTGRSKIFCGPLEISFSRAPANPESVQGILDALDSARGYVADRATEMLVGNR